MNKDQMRKFTREYIAKYPSVAKIYDAVAGPRRMGSEVTVTNYVRGVARLPSTSVLRTLKLPFKPCSKERLMQGQKLINSLTTP